MKIIQLLFLKVDEKKFHFLPRPVVSDSNGLPSWWEKKIVSWRVLVVHIDHFTCYSSGLGNHTFWKCAITLFFVWKKCDLEFAHFLHIRFFERANVQSLIFLHIFKEPKNVQLHIHTILKSKKMCDCTFSKSENVRMCKNVQKKCNFEITL